MSRATCTYLNAEEGKEKGMCSWLFASLQYTAEIRSPFDDVARGMRLTQWGQLLLTWAAHIQPHLQNIMDQLTQVQFHGTRNLLFVLWQM